jgi:predicted hydrolase (HD superfamily)
MSLPTKDAARTLLREYVRDTYQQLHAEMVARAMEGYAEKLGEDTHLWWLTGYLHDIDYDAHPTEHPGPSLVWFNAWGYPPELIQAVLAHADGFNGFSVKPEHTLDWALVACDEICGIFYAYQKLNPIPFRDMKAASLKKRLQEPRFAPGISRDHIHNAVAGFGVTIDEHITNLITFFGTLPDPVTP